MKTHARLKDEILKSLGNGLVKLIVGAPGAGKSFFLSHDLFLALNEEEANKVVLITPSSFESIPALLEQKGDCSRFIVLADDIFSFPHREALFDAFAGKDDTDLIASSSILPDFALGEDATLIRGRYERLYFSPLSYEDSLALGLSGDLSEYLEKGGLFLGKERCLEKALREGASFKGFRKDYASKIASLFELVLAHLDEPISPIKLTELSNGKINHVTLASYLGFLEGCSLLFSLEREDLLKGRVKSRERVYYAGDASFLKGKGRLEAREKSLILTKLFSEGFSARSGYVYTRTDGVYGALDVAFVLERGRERVYLSYSSGDGAKESETMARYLKNSFPKVVVVPFATLPWRDEEGIVHVGLTRFLTSEMSEILGG